MKITPEGGSISKQPKTTVGGRDKSSANGLLSYKLGSESRHYALWVTKVEQPHELSGDTQQGRFSNHFYPKAYAPGQYQVSIICSSQQDYQDLAVFVRYHHEALIQHVGDFDTQNRASTGTSSDFNLLLNLRVPGEAINCRGWIDSFTLTREGFKNVAPEYTFPFTVVYDYSSADYKRSAINVPTPFTPQPKVTP